jgi:hypothetical protein
VAAQVRLIQATTGYGVNVTWNGLLAWERLAPPGLEALPSEDLKLAGTDLLEITAGGNPSKFQRIAIRGKQVGR